MLRKSLCTMAMVLMLFSVLAPVAGARSNKYFRPHRPYYHAPVGQTYFLPQVAELQSRWYRNNPWGKMLYRLWSRQFLFTFQGHNLTPRQSYTLIYNGDADGSGPVLCLGTASANRHGEIGFTARIDVGSLPMPGDVNPVFMLVPSATVQCEDGIYTATAANVLVSFQPVKYVDTDGGPAVDNDDEPEQPPAGPEDEGTGDTGTGSDTGGGTTTDIPY